MYRRFLNKRDYLAVITETALDQLTRGVEQRFEQAEQAAEAAITDYLSENYEIERELDKGKFLFQYDRRITYPTGSHFYLDGEICEAIQAINGCKAPANSPYWVEYEGLADVKVKPYSQMLDYRPGDMALFNDRVYECAVKNGYDFNDIRVPGVEAWQEAGTSEWEATDYNEWDVVHYDGGFFTLITKDNFDPTVNPMDSDCWGKVADYDIALDTYELSDNEYVVYNGAVFFPVVNPNSDKPEVGVNIRHNDPRNYNIKRHMTQLALYELHKLISPNNISQVRADDYDRSIQWLRDANRLKLNPHIPRKSDNRGEPVTDWQMATFQTDYDPYKNPWHV